MNSLYLTIASALLLTASACNNVQDTPKTPEMLKFELQHAELENPLRYLDDIDVTMQGQTKMVKKGGLFRAPEYASDGAIVEGKIVNNATLAKYKDVQLTFSYYSATETLIDSESFVLYKFVEPGATIPFTIKTNPPAAYKNFGCEIIGATPVYEYK